VIIAVKQFVVTPSAGKRLIAKAITSLPEISNALKNRTIVIIAGTTNGYVAEEILTSLKASDGFSRKNFFRGVTMPPTSALTSKGRLNDESKFPGDVVITKGKWRKGITIFDIVDELKEGDIILKGANAVDLQRKQAAILIGHPRAGTIAIALQAVLGRRVNLIIPVGLEKRVSSDLFYLAQKVNLPGACGFRLFPTQGQIITEIEAIKILTGADTELISAGGVCGAEGSCWLAITGTEEQEAVAEKLLTSVAPEPAFSI